MTPVAFHELYAALDREPSLQRTAVSLLDLSPVGLEQALLYPGDCLLLAVDYWLQHHAKHTLSDFVITAILALLQNKCVATAEELQTAPRDLAPQCVLCIADARYLVWSSNDDFYDLDDNCRLLHALPKPPLVYLIGDITAIWFDMQDRLNEFYNDRQSVDTALREVAADKADISESGDLRYDAAGAAD